MISLLVVTTVRSTVIENKSTHSDQSESRIYQCCSKMNIFIKESCPTCGNMWMCCTVLGIFVKYRLLSSNNGGSHLLIK